MTNPRVQHSGRMRKRRLRWRMASMVVAILGTSPTSPSAAPQKLSIAILLDQYDRGEFDAVAGGLENATGPDLYHLDADLARTATSWIDSGGRLTARRRSFVAGALALDITHALVARFSFHSGLGSHVLNPVSLLEVTRLIAGSHTAPSSVEHDWILGCLATWEEWDSALGGGTDLDWRSMAANPAWALMLGERQLIQHAVQASIDKPVFLKWALERFPNESRLRLAVAEAHEALETRCPSANQFCHDEMTPAAVEDLRVRAKASPPDDQAAHCYPDCWPARLDREIHDSAVANLAAFDRLLPMASVFAGLANDDPTVRAEADVHVGYLAIRAARPDAALQPLAAAATSDDGYVRYLAQHFTGRALEMLGRRADAIAAYRHALAVVPGAPATSTLLAAQLFASDDAAERLEAHSVLEAAMTASPRPIDPWDSYWLGDSRLRTVYVGRLRQDLRP